MTSTVALLPDGRLDCYRHFSNQNGPLQLEFVRTVRNDFRNTRKIFATTGAIYRIDTAGNLFWYRMSQCGDLAGPGSWVGGPGWDQFKDVFGGPGGAIYAVRQDNTLARQYHLGYQNGTWNWLP